jgi:hypothetical protein
MATPRRANWESQADTRALQAAALDATGHWVAGLATWRYFVTLTHALVAVTSVQPVTSRKHRSGWSSYTRVGVSRHNRLVRDWFHEVVRPDDPTARWWSETELHASGQPHEHGLLACAEPAPVFSWLGRWYGMKGGGIWKSLPFSQDPDERVRAACYVEKAAKYAGKMASQAPKVWGFGLLRDPSFSQVLR